MQELEDYIKRYFKYSDVKIIRTDRKNSTGSYDKNGYLILKIKGKQFKAHRVVWFLCKGYFPKQEIDHINRVRDDNRIENLRLSNRKEQALNTTKKVNSDTGVVGIYLDKATKGLLAKYSFHFGNKTYRFRNVSTILAI